MKKILISNDDGINASGIIRLAIAAQKYGEVWVVSPDFQRSGASHSINLHNSIDVYESDKNDYKRSIKDSVNSSLLNVAT